MVLAGTVENKNTVEWTTATCPGTQMTYHEALPNITGYTYVCSWH